MIRARDKDGDGLPETEAPPSLYDGVPAPELNSYTASLWVSVATALAGLKQGTRIGAFSYGSGFGGELLTLSAGPAAAKGAWLPAAERDLDEREMLDAAAYTALRAGHAKA